METFGPMVGDGFRVVVEHPELIINLKLVAATKNQPANRPFSLIFEGPSAFPLNQQITTLKRDNGQIIEIFLVPISDDSTIRRYEAVFN